MKLELYKDKSKTFNWEIEDDDGNPSVSYSTELSVTRIKAQLSFESDESAQKFFDSVDDEMAKDIYESLVQKYKEFCDGNYE